MVADGIYYAVALAAGGGIVSFLTRPIYGLPMFLLAAFCLYFFRDPDREVPAGPVAVSPADGKIVSIHRESPELTRISIFLNIFDVHVNRAPVSGAITDVCYRPGRFLVASREEASLENEQNAVTIEGETGRVVFKQIAGLIARRIVFSKKQGEAVRAGERVGLIKFGSRVDVFLGPAWEIQVAEGSRVKAGSSILARLGSREEIARQVEPPVPQVRKSLRCNAGQPLSSVNSVSRAIFSGLLSAAAGKG